MRRQANRDLWLVVCAAGLSAEVVTFVHQSALRIVPGLLLVFVLPGYALAVALFPERGSRRWERALLAAAFGIALMVLGGLELDRSSRLYARSWAVHLALFTVAACFAAGWRRRGVTGAGVVGERSPWRPSLVAVTAAVAAVFVTADAVVLARSAVETGRVQEYSSLWLYREHSPSPGIVVGVASAELRPTTYRLLLVSPSGVVLDRPLRLDPGRTWKTVAVTRAAAAGAFQALLYRHGSSVPYRRVGVAAGT